MRKTKRNMRNKRVDNRKALCYNNVVAVLKPQNNKCADVMELADMLVLETSASACRFKSCHPHQLKALGGLSAVGFLFAIRQD